MPRQDHWNRVGDGEGERVWKLCDMVSVNIVINILVHINVHDTQYKFIIYITIFTFIKMYNKL